MKNKGLSFITIIVSALVALTISIPSNAQRTMKGQWFATADYCQDFRKEGRLLGPEVIVGQYFSGFYWDAGVSMLARLADGKSGIAHRGMYLLEGGACYRLFSTRSHMVDFYVGCDVVFGYDFGNKVVEYKETEIDINSGLSSVVNQSAKVPVTVSHGISYGLVPKVEMEFFPLKTVAVVGGLRTRLLAQTYDTTVEATAGAGISSTMEVTKTDVSLVPSFYAGLRLNF